jgi:DNA-binding XRE family transcriptional regulator
MANLATAIREEVSRLARKEIRSEVAALKKHSAQYRRDIAALKRTVQQQTREIAVLRKALVRNHKRRIDASTDEQPQVRFSPIWLKKHRAKLGLSAENYAKLVEVSPLSIYHWESGKTTPREQQKAKLAQVRSLGKREALRLLDELA